MPESVTKIWDKIAPSILNHCKVYVLKRFINETLINFHKRIEGLVYEYSKKLPTHVRESEIDDLLTIARLEFIETVKVWAPSKNDNIWMLARQRVGGALKDHIRYITRTDPSRVYEWVVDAAYMYKTVQQNASFQEKFENGDQLNRLLSTLSFREKKVVVAHTRSDLTFKEIGKKLQLSESQASRIYKKAIEKMRKALHKSSL